MEKIQPRKRLNRQQRKKLNMVVDENTKHQLQTIARYYQTSMTETIQSLVADYYDFHRTELVEFRKKNKTSL